MGHNSNEMVRKISAKANEPDSEALAKSLGRPVVGRELFEALHRQYRGRLVESLMGLVRDRDRAEDIASYAFNTAWEKRDTFKGESRASTWLQAIARNAVRRSWAREQPNRFASLDQENAGQFAAPECVANVLEKDEELSRLKKALAQLPARHREVLVAHFVHGLSTREIAARLSLPVGTVLSRIYTAKQLLRHAWDSPPPLSHIQPDARTGTTNERSGRESAEPPAPDR